MTRNSIAAIVRMLFATAALGSMLLGALSARAAEDTLVYLPMLTASRAATPPPAGGGLPAELVGTWFSGRLLNLEFYDRNTNTWSDAGGLGHMYVFSANGTYTLVSFLKLGAGTTCESTVSKYHTGTARVEGNQLLLTPTYARTRTSVCRTAPVELEGPYETTAVPWRIGEDQYRHTRLWLNEVQGETQYYKDGLGPQVVGAWANGDRSAIDLYDPASGTWAEPTGEDSEWYAFSANGTYRHGKADASYGDDPCREVTMTYDQGTLTGSGSDITTKATMSLRRVVSLCDPSSAEDTTLSNGSAERWSWNFDQRAEGMGLSLLRVSSGFLHLFLLPVE